MLALLGAKYRLIQASAAFPCHDPALGISYSLLSLLFTLVICRGNADSIIKTQCPIDPYVILPDRCSCVDQQNIKLQEAPEMVPVGELPRHVLLTAQSYLVNKITPGTRVIVNGVYSIFQNRNSVNLFFCHLIIIMVCDRPQAESLFDPLISAC